MGSSSATRGATDDVESIALEKSDAKAVDDQAKFAERQRSAVRTQSLEQARVASSRNDRSTEISLLTTVLQNGATGYEKAEALKRLCDAYEALGQPDRGDPYCDQLLREFPDTVAAKVVTQRRGASQRSPAKAAPADRKATTSY
jgi:lipopolysaccharide biosynthesis regulator YciM